MKKTSYAMLTWAFMFLMALSPSAFASPKPPKHVHAHIKPAKSITGEISIDVHAPVTDTFLLKIFDAADIQVVQQTVSGGSTTLPPLLKGKYSFSLLNKDSVIVYNGKFEIKLPKSPKPDTSVNHPPHVHVHFKGTYVDEPLIIHVRADSTEEFSLTILDSSGANVQTAVVTGGKNELPPLPLGKYSFVLVDFSGDTVETGKFKIKAPHVHVHVRGGYYNEPQVLHVNADTTEAFTLTIFNSADSIINVLTVYGGNNTLPALPVGKYSFILTDENGAAVEKGKFSVKIRPVHTGIHPNPSNTGEGTILVDAPSIESFTLKIYDASLVLLYTSTVPGGITSLPSLTSGIYYYKVFNLDDIEVSKGRIMIY